MACNCQGLKMVGVLTDILQNITIFVFALFYIP